jgi:hypothetical protein
VSAPLQATEADRAALAEVLARPEFRDRARDASALRRLLEGLWDRLLEALGTVEAERYASLGRAVFLAAVAVAALLAWRALARRRRPGARAVAAPGTPPQAALRAAPPGAAAAEAALARGELGAAVRQAYAAAAAVIGGRAASGDALTGPELAARAGDEGFRALARLHDRTVFGRRAPTEPEARQAVEVARRLAPAGGGR